MAVSGLPETGRVPSPVSAGRVEIVTSGWSGEARNTDFRAVSFYLKACFAKSEIVKVTFFRKSPFLRFRRPYPTLLSKVPRNYNPENPVLPHTRALLGSWDSWEFGTSLGVDFEKSVGKPDSAHGEVWISGQILFSFPMEIHRIRGFPGKPLFPGFSVRKQSI